MKRPASSLILLFILLTSIACASKKEKTDTEEKDATEETASSENVTELTYRQFYDLMFEDYSNRLEWHEDDYNQEGKEFILISERSDCESENCGQKVYIKNTSSDQTIRTVIKTSFSIPNTLPYIANQFVMAPGDEVYLTCTKFCFGSGTYDLAHEVVVAEYKAAD